MRSDIDALNVGDRAVINVSPQERASWFHSIRSIDGAACVLFDRRIPNGTVVEIKKRNYCGWYRVETSRCVQGSADWCFAVPHWYLAPLSEDIHEV